MPTQLKLLLAATLVLGGALGFVAGRGTVPATSQDAVLSELARQRVLLEEHLARPAAAAAPAEVRCAVAPTVDATWLRAELARALREELGPRPTDAAAAEPRPPPEPSPQHLAALQQGQRIIDDAARARRWTDDDARALRRALVDMTDAQRAEVMRQLAVTLNSNTLDVQTQGLPF